MYYTAVMSQQGSVYAEEFKMFWGMSHLQAMACKWVRVPSKRKKKLKVKLSVC
jgi:hypothetical protein